MRFLVSSLLCLIGFYTFAQSNEKWYLLINGDKIKLDLSSDSLLNQKKTHNAINQLSMSGYVGLHITDTLVENKKHYILLDYSKKIKKVMLINKNESIHTNYNQLVNDINNQIVDLENNGFPFASVTFTQQEIKENTLYLTYEIDSGAYFKIDHIYIKSQDKINENHILNIVNIKAGDAYNESKIKKIKQLLINSGFYELMRPVELVFKPEKTDVYIYLKKKSASSTDGYVGIVQDNTTQKTTLNGYVNLDLQNNLNQGESFVLNWKNSVDETQNLNIEFDYPYLFHTPFGVESDLSLLKQDTTFITLTANFGVYYNYSAIKLGLYNEIKSSNLLSDTVLADFTTYRKNTIGIKLEYTPILSDVWTFYQPEILLKNGVYNYQSDSIQQRTQVKNFSYLYQIKQSFKFLKYFTYTNTFLTEGLTANYDISENEKIYFGGLKSVRGFYELELIGNEVYALLNEIKFEPISGLQLKILYDYSNFKANNITNYTNSVGFGFGLTSNNTILEIIIANGMLNDNPFSVSNTKIHLGFTTTF